MNDVASRLGDLARSSGTRAERARAAAGLIRLARPYRWVGLYDVTAIEIAIIAWDGPEPPTYPRFPASKGLNGAAVASKRPVVVQDVANDPRYLTTIGGTRGEMIYPILRSATVIGTTDVESERLNAFCGEDESLLATCAAAVSWLWP